MENLISTTELKRNESLLKKHIFTPLQLRVLQKKMQQRALNSTEKTYYYKFIRPKVKALVAFSGRGRFIRSGEEWMIPERIPQAEQLLHRLKQKHKTANLLLSGSFLFHPEFRDIDVFIFSKYQKEDYRWRRVHVNYLPESALASLFFSSVSQISISSFKTDAPKQFAISIQELLQAYELVVKEILNHEDYQKSLRDFLLRAEYLTKNSILNPQQLYILRKKFSRGNTLLLLQKYLAETLALHYQKADLQVLKVYIRDYQQLSKAYKESANLQQYIHTYREALELAS